jgi:Tol biopolymer transport system component
VNVSTGDITEIIEPRKYLREPRWLPTNRTVVWREMSSPQDDGSGYWLRSFDPPGERRLSGDATGWSITHDVAPDGTEFVFMSLPGGTRPFIWNQATKALRVLPGDLATWRYEKHLGYPMQGFRPSWHPNGDQILFWDGTWVFLYDLTTNTGCEINLNSFDLVNNAVRAASWSPNGRYLLLQISQAPPFMSTAGPFDRMLVLDTDTGEAVKYALGNPVAHFSWAPDSQTVAVSGLTGENIGRFPAFGFYLLNVRSGEYQRILAEHVTLGGMGEWLAWSPDGKTLAFQCMNTPRDMVAGVFDRICTSQILTNR